MPVHVRPKFNRNYIRNIIFGLEDSLVSTVGVLFGLASSNEYSPHHIIITGLVLISVEAISMGVGSYLAEMEISEIEQHKKRSDNPIIDGLFMFGAYLLAGLFVLAPYVLVRTNLARYYSTVATLLTLYLLGFIPTKKFSDGLRMVVIAGFALIMGFLVATLLRFT